MAAPKGNRFWELRSSHGRTPIFHDADELWDAACEYFTWVEDHYFEDDQLFAYQGAVTRETVYKPRPMTLNGMCLFLDISDDTWVNYCDKKDFLGVTARIKKVIYEQKFAGAAAGHFNANIIARDLGLADKAEAPKPSTDLTITIKRAARDD